MPFHQPLTPSYAQGEIVVIRTGLGLAGWKAAVIPDPAFRGFEAWKTKNKIEAEFPHTLDVHGIEPKPIPTTPEEGYQLCLHLLKNRIDYLKVWKAFNQIVNTDGRFPEKTCTFLKNLHVKIFKTGLSNYAQGHEEIRQFIHDYHRGICMVSTLCTPDVVGGKLLQEFGLRLANELIQDYIHPQEDQIVDQLGFPDNVYAFLKDEKSPTWFEIPKAERNEFTQFFENGFSIKKTGTFRPSFLVPA